MVAWLAVSCGSSENGPPTVSWSSEPVIKTASGLSFGDTGTVDTEDVRGYTSLAIDPDDKNPAIAYYDYTNGNLKYAKWDGSDWDDKTTVDSTDDVGKYANLIFDSSGCPSIAYYKDEGQGEGALMWAYDEDDDGEWDDHENWPMVIADSESGDFGYEGCSHDYGINYFGFAFYDATDDDLHYFEYHTITAHTSMVEPDTGGDVGMYCSLKFKGSTPTVSYYDATNGRLKYATESTPFWDVEVVDDPQGEDVGKYTSLDYDYSGNASIAYYDESNDNPKWIRWDEEEDDWGDPVTLVDTEKDWGRHISHEWYNSNVCGFAFEAVEEVEGEDENHLKFVRWTSLGQTTYDADDTYNCGDHCSMAWVKSGGNQGDVWISHCEFENKDLRYAHGEEE